MLLVVALIGNAPATGTPGTTPAPFEHEARSAETPTPTVEFRAHTQVIDRPTKIISGPDGALWFLNDVDSRLNRLSTDGQLTTSTPANFDGARAIAAGPDGNIWFAEAAAISRLHPGGWVTSFDHPGISSPRDMTGGPDGALWFINGAGHTVGRVTTDGEVSIHPVPGATRLERIAAGPDDALWLTDRLGDTVWRLGTDGDLTSFTDPAIAAPRAITAGPDGALWFTTSDSVGRLTTDGDVTAHSGAGIDSPRDITAGPDDAVWFTDTLDDTIGRISVDGEVTTFAGVDGAMPEAITAGPDGALWFTNWGDIAGDTPDSIGRITTDGDVTATDADLDLWMTPGLAVGADDGIWFSYIENDMESLGIARIATDGAITSFGHDVRTAGAWNLTPGPDSAVWFTAEGVGEPLVGRITTEGVISTFTDPEIDDPFGITAGPDGNLWFANRGGDSIGRITTDGTLDVFHHDAISEPHRITSGPDGNLWFTNLGSDTIGQITTSGDVTIHTDPSIVDPYGITAGPDGALWFTNAGDASIGRITPKGEVTSYTEPGIGFPLNITVGPDGALWFTSWLRDGGADAIGRVTIDGEVTTYTDTTLDMPSAIVAGPDGNLWFGGEDGGSIGQAVLSYPPAAPTDVVAVAGDGEATVTWTPPDVEGGPPITSFTVTASPGGAICTTSTTASCTVDGLTNGTPHTFTVVASTSAGNSPPSTPSEPVTPQAPPPSHCGDGATGPFVDVVGEHPFCSQIAWLATSGITSGYPDGTFRPTVAVSRQAMAAFLHRVAGEPDVPTSTAPFADIDPSHPFATPIGWMAATGLSTGTLQPNGDRLFHPTDPVSRQAMAAFLHRFAGAPEPTLDEPAFADVDPSHPFATPIGWMAATGIATGTAQPGGLPTFAPAAPVSRQAMAAFLQRFDEAGDLPSD